MLRAPTRRATTGRAGPRPAAPPNRPKPTLPLGRPDAAVLCGACAGCVLGKTVGWQLHRRFPLLFHTHRSPISTFYLFFVPAATRRALQRSCGRTLTRQLSGLPRWRCDPRSEVATTSTTTTTSAAMARASFSTTWCARGAARRQRWTAPSACATTAARLRAAAVIASAIPKGEWGGEGGGRGFTFKSGLIGLQLAV